MTKNELADRVPQRIGIAAEQVRQALDASFDAVADELASGGEVALAEFGKFSVSHRSARQGRSPSTGRPSRNGLRCLGPEHVFRISRDI